MPITGSLPVIPTPFWHGKIDYESLERLLDHLVTESDGYTLGGSTGESVSLSFSERVSLMKFAVDRTPPGKTIVVGITHTNLEEMIALGKLASDLGVHGVLVPPPFYFPNSFPMILEFFRSLDRSCDLPIIFYDNPVYTKTWLRAEDLLRLADNCKHVVAVKMTDHDLSKIPILKESGLAVFAGDDATTFRSLLLGVDGSMTIAPSIFPGAYQATVRLLAEQNAVGALRLFSQIILPTIHIFGPGDEIAVTKGLFKWMGFFRSAELRLPLLPCSDFRLREAVLAYETGMSFESSMNKALKGA